jgi:uncharacterized protein YjbI with pentapeptide repeats
MKSLPFPFQSLMIDLNSKTFFSSGFSCNFDDFSDLSGEYSLKRMEIKHYLSLLKQDVEAWNQWRKGEGEIISLAGVQLRRASLRRALLSGIDLSGADLTQADLRRAFLCNASLIGADLTQADLSRASLTSANLRGANLSQVSLKWACLTGADLREANLTGADFTGADLTDADLSGADLTGANLIGADLTGVSLVHAQARSTNFQGAILTGVCLEDWKIDTTTQLDELICDYLYLESGRKGRCPSSGSLALGEITQLLQAVLIGIEPFGTQEQAN